MSFRIVFVEEVRVVGADELYAVLLCQVDEDGIDAFLHFVGFAIGLLCRVGHFMTLQLDVVVVAPNVVEPLDCLFCALEVTVLNLPWNFAANAG